LTDDDDIDSLGDPNDGFGPTILPYPGVDDYGNWLESQFPSVIPTGTSYFLKQLDMENEADVTHWANLDAPNYLDLLGPKQYDAIRKVLAEIKTIRRFIVSQDITSTKPWSYQEYLSHRSKFLPIDTCSFPSSKDLTDPKLLAMKNIKVPKSHIPPYTPKSPNVHSAPDPPTYESSYHSMTSKSGHSYHTTRPKMCMDGEYFDMHSPKHPIQFWGASNSNWKRAQRTSHGSNSSSHSGASSHHSHSHKSRSHHSYISQAPSRHNPNSRRTGGPPDGLPSHSGHSSTRSIVPRSRQVPKVRSSLSEKILWDGQCSTFRPYKLAITGHLLQVGAGYLVDSNFHQSYTTYAKVGDDYLESEAFRVKYPDISLAQARLDRTYLYGMLISSNRKDGERKIILKYEHNQDGIAAWIEFIRDYDNNGSEDIRANKLERLILDQYSHKYPGGFLKYIDTLQAHFNELDTLLPGHYLDNQKRRILFRNLKGSKPLRYLIQACKDRDLTYQDAATYLRVHGADIDDEEDARKVQQVEKADDKSLNYEEARQLYCTMAEESGPRQAYNVLKGHPALRESLKIPYKIWKRLSESIQNEIKDIRDQLEESKPPDSRPINKPSSTPKSLPPQYGLKRNTNVAKQQDEDVNRLAAVLQSYTIENCDTLSDEDSNSDEDIRMGGMVQTIVDLNTPMKVQANVEYEKRFVHLAHTPKSSYAICDSGADSCVVGRLAKIQSVTMRTANLVGYDPETTKSSSLPIVTALLKTMSAENVPLLLRVNEAVYNQNSPITLLSEYQIREYGKVVDSVAMKHHSTDGNMGTQTLYASEVVRCPLVDRGGLMGLELFPVEEGDENRYEIFDITSDQPWIPRSFQENNKAYVVQAPSSRPPLDKPTRLIHNIQLDDTNVTYFDPSDIDLPSYGVPVQLELDENAIVSSTISAFVDNLTYDHLTGYDEYYDDTIGFSMDEVPKVSRNFDSYAFATKAWHRVIHKDLDPAQLQPYLGFRPSKIIRETLARTTQLAKMIIRYPLRRHIKSRIPHLNVHRINEVISTDPVFSNVKSM
jgi:hypothetical protein